MGDLKVSIKDESTTGLLSDHINLIMTHLDTELFQLKNEIIEMWKLVGLQLKKTHNALITFDKDLAREVMATEKRVNAMELKVDRDCENIFALFNPVAVDLRFVLAVLKINSNLERIGDIAEGLARLILIVENRFDAKLLEATRILIMYEEANKIVEDVLQAFENEETKIARGIFMRDEFLDEINSNCHVVLIDYITLNPDKIEQGLYILSAIRKLERVGDQCKNIAEEIIFYLEAKVLKHKGNTAK